MIYCLLSFIWSFLVYIVLIISLLPSRQFRKPISHTNIYSIYYPCHCSHLPATGFQCHTVTHCSLMCLPVSCFKINISAIFYDYFFYALCFWVCKMIGNCMYGQTAQQCISWMANWIACVYGETSLFFNS